MQTAPAMPSANLNMILDQVAKDKGIERPVLVETLEQAIKQAAQKTFGMERNIEATFNVEKGVVQLFQAIQIVPEVADPFNQISLDEAQQRGIEAGAGDELLFEIFYREEDAEEAKVQDERYGDILKLKTYRRGFGRIAAQTAKQVIISRVRDAEREIVYNEYKDRKGEIVTGISRRFERGNIIVDLGRAEAVLPVREQVPRESYRAGDRVQAYVLDVLRESKGPQIILSRASVSLLTKLFEMEVPEIAEQIVVIEAAAREPGGRAKIAVASRDNDVDPVGACVGMKGSRVQAVVQELRGEKIDIVPYDRDPARFVCAAIQPAEVNKVIVDEADGRMELVVPDEKLSLAIGRKGQNVRLAAQLTGWKLDIISESKFKQMEEEAITALQQIDGVNEAVARSMYRLGFRALEELTEATEQELAAIPGLGGAEAAQKIKDAAETTMERLRQQRIQAASTRVEPLTERERLLFVRGIGERTIQLLEEAGYKSVEDLHREDEDKLAIKTGLGIKKARAIKQGAEHFLSSESKVIEQARREAARAAKERSADAPS